jgi:acetamidase/formamidase
MDHYLSSNPDHMHWGLWGARQNPVITIASGDRVTIETLLAEPGELDMGSGEDDRGQESPPRLLTGPVHIENAEPGDVLVVRVVDIRLRADWGWNMQKPTSKRLRGDSLDFCRQHVSLDRTRNVARLPWGRELRLSPCFGDIGVAPPETCGRSGSGEKQIFSGHLDNEDFGIGCTAYLPIFVRGALFSAGHGHALLNDSDDVRLTAIETALAGTFEFHVHRNRRLSAPRIASVMHRH